MRAIVYWAISLSISLTVFSSTSYAQDPELYKVLQLVFNDNSVCSNTCLYNTQVLIKAAVEHGLDLSDAQVLVFKAGNNGLLYPSTRRWPDTPYYRFHVVLVKDNWVYDFTTIDRNDRPRILPFKDYLVELFPPLFNDPATMRFNAVPALEMLLPAHRERQRTGDFKSFIDGIWRKTSAADYYTETAFAPATWLNFSNIFKNMSYFACLNLLQ